ncbi:MAG: PHB depolymerase family esterase [Gammaproteobacteria bacterium]|nr:PHB depolymerase family esterase [Gammaproteobacteria bacterium]
MRNTWIRSAPAGAAFVLFGLSSGASFAAAVCGVQATPDRNYKLCVPSSYDPAEALPLVVMLHGCSETAASFSFDTEMDAYAESRRFIVAYPEQPASANGTQCWNWFLPEHQARGAGEPASIAGVVQAVSAAYNVDADRVYAAGLSAGGAMATIVGAAYPDVFAAIGVSAGLEYKGGEDLAHALAAQELGGPDPDRQGRVAHAAMGAQARVVPAMVFHGSLDQTVRTVNGRQVVAQWAQTNDLTSDGADDDNIDATPELVECAVSAGGMKYTHSVFEDGNGETVLEHYLVDGQTHSWSGGAVGGQYTAPNGPEASTLMLDFFQAHPMTAATGHTAGPSGGGGAAVDAQADGTFDVQADTNSVTASNTLYVTESGSGTGASASGWTTTGTGCPAASGPTANATGTQTLGLTVSP